MKLFISLNLSLASLVGLEPIREHIKLFGLLVGTSNS